MQPVESALRRGW